jgi:penicillin amidase
MRLVKFLMAAIITLFLVWLGNSHNPFGSSAPALGKFLSPFDGFWQNAESSALLNVSDITFPELKGETSVLFDERLVPHIFASNEEDAFFAQGYITAQYRLWQMDISVRATGGYLSEILGERLLKRDIQQRRKGMRLAAEKQVKTWKKTGEIKLIEAYTNGVNAFLAELSPKDYPVEFKLMGYVPEPWSNLKSAIFLRGMVETLSSRNMDLRASNSLKAFGPDFFEFLYPEHNPKQTPIIPEEKTWDFDPVWKDTVQVENTLSHTFPKHQVFENPPEFIGSNNWAVSGKKTVSGLPILCNDPHLGLSLPSIWFEIQITTPEINSYGVSLPGAPGIIIGFNENIAWGVTNLGHDLLDWYSIKWADEEKNTYWVGEDQLEVSFIEEEIKIKGKPTVTEKVKHTLWGPIVHTDEDSQYHDMAMQWVSNYTFSKNNKSQISTFLDLMKAENYNNYSAALEAYDLPPQNFAFAANDGDIAIRVNGKLPIKSDQQGRFILDGSNPDNAWKGFIPMDQLPGIRNPEKGYVTSANQRSTAKDYPYYYNGGFDDYRGRILNRMLTRMENITPKKMMELQNNTFSIKAEEALPLMLEYYQEEGTSQIAKTIINDLSDWDYRFKKDLKAPAVFDRWFNLIYRGTFDEIYSLRDSMDILYPDAWRLIDLMENAPDNEIFDDSRTEDIEDAKAIVTLSFNQLLESMEDKYNNEDFNWQKQKGTHIGHLGNISAFSFMDVPVGGYGSAINAVQDDFGPSWRMIVQLGESPKAWAVYPGGQSGNPGSKFYDNMVLQWAEGQYNELFFMKNKKDDRMGILKEVKLK